LVQNRSFPPLDPRPAATSAATRRSLPIVGAPPAPSRETCRRQQKRPPDSSPSWPPWAAGLGEVRWPFLHERSLKCTPHAPHEIWCLRPAMFRAWQFVAPASVSVSRPYALTLRRRLAEPVGPSWCHLPPQYAQPV
jgi:hypothetical protein